MKDFAKIVIPIVLGTVAGIISMFISQGIRERDAFGIIVLVMLIYIQKFLFPRIGVKIETKDWISISFLSLASWYISWTFLLNL